MKYTPTDEQKEIVGEIQNGTGEIVLVNSVAGSGKSSTARLTVNTIRPKKCLYTAFNKAIVEEGKDLFPDYVECRTLHSLALSYVRPKLGIEPFTYLCIKEKLTYPAKNKVIKAMDEFYRSDSTDLDEFLKEILDDPTLRDIVDKYVTMMFDDKIPVTFNYLLKHMHLLLHEEQIDPKYDMIILDEIQDSTGVALEIFKLLKAPHKMGLGDPMQSIYSFMNLVDGFKVLKDDSITLGLTKSFRCSEAISQRIENYGITNLDKDFMFKGTDTPEADGKLAYITATNAQIILRIIKLHESNTGYVLTRPLKDIFACALALVTAASGKKVMHKQYKFLDKEYTNYTMSGKKGFYSYLNKKTKDEEIKNATGLLMKLKENDINIFEVLAKAKTMKKDKNVTVGTFFSLKGLGFENVHIGPDINGAVKSALKAKKEGCMTDADYTMLKGAYVAASRTKINLINCDYL